MLKKNTLIFLLVFGLITSAYSQVMEAKFSYAPFFKSSVGKYIETYLRIEGDSLRYIINEDSLLEAEIEIIMLFKNDEQIKEYRKYKVVGNPVPDTSTEFPDIIDLQRITIPNGVYNFDLIIKDNHAPDTAQKVLYSDIITVNIPGDEFAYSGVEFLESRVETVSKNIFVKNGYEYQPFVGTEFGPNDDYLRAYVEIYNGSKAVGPLELMVTNFTIEQAFTGKQMKGFKAHSIDRALNYNELYRYINIKDLPTGDYFLNIQTQDSLNRAVGSIKKFFSKINAGDVQSLNYTLSDADYLNVNRDSIASFVSFLLPIADNQEQEIIEAFNDFTPNDELMAFFSSFWNARGGEQAINKWYLYYSEVIIAKEKYGNPNYEDALTHREYIYLKYGSPVSITTQSENVDGVLIESWNYLQLGDLVNKKFVFTKNPGQEFELSQTNMKGEVYNQSLKPRFNH